MIKTILSIMDFVRIAWVWLAFYIWYSIGFKSWIYNPQAQLHFMIPIIILCIAWLSWLEWLLFGKQASELKWYESWSNYQIQSSIALLSYTVIAILIYFLNWWIKAELTIFFCFIFFFIFSWLNHGIQAFKYKNFKWQNINRPFITLLLILWMIYPIIFALKEINN